MSARDHTDSSLQASVGSESVRMYDILGRSSRNCFIHAVSFYAWDWVSTVMVVHEIL